MAIHFDSSASGSASGTTCTFSHTDSGYNAVLYVTTLVDSSKSVTGVTYNGSSMTQTVGSGNVFSTTKTVQFWKIIDQNPDGVAHNVVVTASGSCNILARSASYQNIIMATPTDAEVGGGNDTANQTVSLTTTINNDWIVAGIGSDGNLTASANITIRAGSGTSLVIGDLATTTAGAYTMSLTGTSASGRWAASSLQAIITNITLNDTQGSTDTIATQRAAFSNLTDTVVTSDVVSEVTDKWKTESQNSGNWTAESKSL